MEFWLCLTIIILCIVILIQSVRLHLLRRSAREISDAFAEKIAGDTNTLIDISSHDRYMRQLANNINKELKKLRSEHLRFQQGDWELKNAVTGISHDLRTPLTAICGYLDLLDKAEKSDEVSRYLKIIRNRTEALRQLTEELFRYSVFTSVSDGTPDEPLILNRILEDSISGFYAALRQHGITPKIHLPEAKIHRTLNRSALTRVIGNLISNALKYSDGDLVIELKETGEILFSNHAGKLDEVSAGRLFDRFYTVETASSDATGLGLSIARALTEQMGGSIHAEFSDQVLSVTVLFPE